MKFKKLIAIAVVVTLAFSVTACGGKAPVQEEPPQDQARIFMDSLGREVEIPAEINTVSPTGPLSQAVLYTACPDKLVGLAVDFTDEAKRILDEKYWNMPIFGQFYGKNANLNLEAIIAENPDVIVDIGQVKKTSMEDLNGLQEQLNMPVVFIDAATMDTLPEMYLKLGELLGNEEEMRVLSDYCEDVLDKADAVRASLSEDELVTVYHASGDVGLHTNARGSFHGEILDKAGAINVADVDIATTGTSSEVSMEQLILWNPQIIVTDRPDLYEMITTDKTWGTLDAVKNGRVYKIPSAPYNLLGNPPAVNRILGTLWIGSLAYPKQYGIDMTAELQKFYKLFYHIELDQEKAAEVMSIQGVQ